MNKIISYTKKNGEEIEISCKGIRGTILYGLIKFCNWLEGKLTEN